MCNHYRNAIRKGAAIPGWSSDQFSEIKIPLRFDNLPTDIYPDKPGVVFRLAGDDLEAVQMRWGFPKVQEKGATWVTNARHVMNKGGPSPYWGEWTNHEYRCLVPATSFLEPDQRTVGTGAFREVEFARADGLPFFFAGMWRPWTGTRGTKKDPVEGEHELYTFLTTTPNALVKPVHSKAMPVILANWEDAEAWLSEPISDAIALQRPAPDDLLKIVAPTPNEAA